MNVQITVGVFGRQDCPDYPLRPVDDGFYTGCLGDQPGWVLLGKVKLSGKNEWVQDEIEFTPQTPIVCIGIGPACSDDYVLKNTLSILYG